MNELILNNIAYETLTHTGALPTRSGIDEYQKKFAELIVKECVEQLMKKHDTERQWHTHYRTAAHIINEHFGIDN